MFSLLHSRYCTLPCTQIGEWILGSSAYQSHPFFTWRRSIMFARKYDQSVEYAILIKVLTDGLNLKGIELCLASIEMYVLFNVLLWLGEHMGNSSPQSDTSDRISKTSGRQWMVRSTMNDRKSDGLTYQLDRNDQ